MHAGEAEGQQTTRQVAIELALDEARQAAAVLAAAGDESLEVCEQHAVEHAALGLAAAPLSPAALEKHPERMTEAGRREWRLQRRIPGGGSTGGELEAAGIRARFHRAARTRPFSPGCAHAAACGQAKQPGARHSKRLAAPDAGGENPASAVLVAKAA